MSSHWAAKVAGRVAANAFLGGLLVGVVGALCLGTAAYGLGTLMDYLYLSLPGAKISRMTSMARLLPPTGIGAGFFGGGFVGASIFVLAASKAPPGRFFAPLSALIGRVALGQIAGTLGALTFFAAVEAFKIQLQNQSLLRVMNGDAKFIALGAPALMICGAIAGALSKRETTQSATLKGE